MDEFVWGRIRSWHAFRRTSRWALCGRWVPVGNDEADDMPSGKTCEVCLRAIARKRGD